MPGPNPSGLCQCGCGAKTNLAARTDKKLGWVKGEPQRYLKGHVHKRGWGADLYTETDTGYVTPCWIWNGSKDKRWGYGKTQWQGRLWYAHLRSWIEDGRERAPDMQLDHLCSQPACVNPAHLEEVTPAVNARRSRKAKLTEVMVREIRDRYAAGGVSQPQLAREYGVTQGNIWWVLHDATWKGI